MTEYLDYLDVGQDVTVTTGDAMLSGEIIDKDEDDGWFEFDGEKEQFRVRHVEGDLLSDDDTGDWPQYEVKFEGDWISVNDVRHGSYATGANPNLEADDRGHPSDDRRRY